VPGLKKSAQPVPTARTLQVSDERSKERSAAPLDAGPISADEPALMALMAQLPNQYKSADVPQQAFMECLEQLGAVFPSPNSRSGDVSAWTPGFGRESHRPSIGG
jgi:hypothetical protein